MNKPGIISVIIYVPDKMIYLFCYIGIFQIARFTQVKQSKARWSTVFTSAISYKNATQMVYTVSKWIQVISLLKQLEGPRWE